MAASSVPDSDAESYYQMDAGEEVDWSEPYEGEEDDWWYYDAEPILEEQATEESTAADQAEVQDDGEDEA
eukprot:5518189-Lingulodinium_polyedra.AAC.1